MIERIEKLEEELKVIRYAYEQNTLFLENDSKNMEELILFNQTILEFMKETDERIKSLQDAFVISTTNTELHFNLIESQGRTIKTILETLQIMQKR
ncbi:hypothetical protein [Flavobacterium tructae]|uniref:Uncharacterized protein n=1 Tax=Flavobacterium tructae TaxID=1114873 RepID=A0A1S1J4C8_9FLAO|nr:hypothetical protein [Flavobacterium tructae]OHT44471.1 hypothetical protein BHE19_12190 [Flavobacterium tructae]OXB19393.1 hypothetical protein B0A71_12680 [Flavobacterium tructae]